MSAFVWANTAGFIWQARNLFHISYEGGILEDPWAEPPENMFTLSVSPEKAHRRQGEWIDLQLPLYRHLAVALGIQDPIQLGYVVLPNDPKKTDILIAEWTEADLKEADRVAEDVVRAVRKEKFWPPAESHTGFFNEFSAICQDGHFGRLVIETESEEGGTT